MRRWARILLPSFAVGGFMAIQTLLAVRTSGGFSTSVIGLAVLSLLGTLSVLWLVMRSD
jgi:hypothetical protein